MKWAREPNPAALWALSVARPILPLSTGEQDLKLLRYEAHCTMASKEDLCQEEKECQEFVFSILIAALI